MLTKKKQAYSGPSYRWAYLFVGPIEDPKCKSK